jgi:hypothetical protein
MSLEHRTERVASRHALIKSDPAPYLVLRRAGFAFLTDLLAFASLSEPLMLARRADIKSTTLSVRLGAAFGSG